MASKQEKMNPCNEEPCPGWHLFWNPFYEYLNGPSLLSSVIVAYNIIISIEDCVISPWDEWTISEGWANRSRRITKEAIGGGKHCQGALMETRECSVERCPSNVGLFFANYVG